MYSHGIHITNICNMKKLTLKVALFHQDHETTCLGMACWFHKRREFSHVNDILRKIRWNSLETDIALLSSGPAKHSLKNTDNKIS